MIVQIFQSILGSEMEVKRYGLKLSGTDLMRR